MYFAKKIDTKLIPELNLITLGHVDHGKSTLTQALSGKWPAIHTEEMKRGITLRLGYADVSVYKCEHGFTTKKKCLECKKECETVRTFSIIDAPGHETLMATVLAGSALADGALFVIAANEGIQAQTKEHLMVLDITGIKNIVVIQNKIDLVTEGEALKNYKEIKKLIKGTIAENAPIIPVSAQQKINIDVLLDVIEKNIPTPKRDTNKNPLMYMARSFDINKPGTEIEKLQGGVLGGSIIQGTLKVGDEIEIKPGVQKNGWFSLKTKIIGLQKAGKNIKEAGAGGLLGLKTELDPFLTKSDSLAGSVVGLPDKLPETRNELNLKVKLLERIIAGDVKPINVNEPLMIIVGVAKTVGVVTKIGNVINLKLKLPVCCDKGEKVAISRLISDRWRLIGVGEVV